MNEHNSKKIAEIFQDARITDELRPASIKKYASSVRKFFAVIGDKDLEDVSNDDFDNFVMRMKENGAGGSRPSGCAAAHAAGEPGSKPGKHLLTLLSEDALHQSGSP